MKQHLSGFDLYDLDASHKFLVGKLPEPLMPNSAQFEMLWHMHPREFHEIEMYGRPVKTPRWQQALGWIIIIRDESIRRCPIPPILDPFLRCSGEQIDRALNRLLLNCFCRAFHWGSPRQQKENGSWRPNCYDLTWPGADFPTASLAGKP
jgi:hypothetical protein